MVSTTERIRDDGTVLVAVKTPLMPKPTTSRMPGQLNLRQSVEHLTKERPKDAHAARVVQQLAREMSDVHHFLAVRPTGVEKVDPEKTTLDQIAVPREVRTNRGLDHVRVAAFEVQSYAKVGC
jgi:hypothetical protein